MCIQNGPPLSMGQQLLGPWEPSIFFAFYPLPHAWLSMVHDDNHVNLGASYLYRAPQRPQFFIYSQFSSILVPRLLQRLELVACFHWPHYNWVLEDGDRRSRRKWWRILIQIRGLLRQPLHFIWNDKIFENFVTISKKCPCNWHRMELFDKKQRVRRIRF